MSYVIAISTEGQLIVDTTKTFEEADWNEPNVCETDMNRPTLCQLPKVQYAWVERHDMAWFRHIRTANELEPPYGLLRRQHLTLTFLNLSVLIALVLIHVLFAKGIGEPPKLVYVLIAVRTFALVGEAYYLADGERPFPFNSSKGFALVSIGANLLFAFAVGYVADLHDSHYHVLMLLPIIAAAFQYSLYATLSIVAAATALTFLQMYLYYVRHPPLDADEFFEAATMTVNYLLVGVVVWLLTRQVRADQKRLSMSLSELNRTQKRLVAEEKLAAVGSLASAIAHEIRNPVAMIRSSLQMLDRTGTISESDRQEMFNIARKESDRLTQLTTDFLNFAKPRPPELQQVGVCSLTKYVSSVVKPHAMQRQQRCVTDCPDDFQVVADPLLLHQLLINLTLNALDASADAAIITLGASKDADGGAMIHVKNPGPAIPPAVEQSIFEPFFTTKRAGTGLGLAIARNIALAHQGELFLSTNTDTQVIFTFRLPAAMSGRK